MLLALKSQLSRGLENAAVLHYVLSSLGGSVVAISMFLYLLSTRYYYFPLAYTVWMYLDNPVAIRQGRRVEFVRRFFMWRYLASYFPINLHKTTDLDPSKNYIFCYHPHGIFPVSCFVNFGTESTGFSRRFPGITVHLLTLDATFYAPILRDYALAFGAASVSHESITYKLTKLGPGHSVLIIIGGTAEVELASPDNPYRLKLNNRHGFIREALSAGASLVPVFSFGESEVWYLVKPTPNSFFDRLWNLCRRAIRGVPIIIHGEYLIMPFRRPINTVVGSALDLPRISNPTDEQIKYWHVKYIEALKKLFYDNKERFGSPGKDLELL